jgi:hypothetical protein
MNSRSGRLPLPTLAAFACAIAVLAVSTAGFRGFMSDDAFISLRYAERFLQGHGLTWNDGERVEGYTNLLWILGVSLFGRLGLDLITAARVLGFLGTAGAIAAVVWVYRSDTIRGVIPGLAGGLAIALAGPTVVWTVGGLEQPLLAGLLAWAIALSLPLLEEARPSPTKVLLPGLFLALVILTRADGAIFTVAAVLGIAAARGFTRDSLRIGAILAALPLLFFAGQLAFRLSYYGEWLPNSAYAKVAFTLVRIQNGVQYVLGALYLVGLLIPAALALRVTDIQRRRTVRFLGVVLAVWLGYVILVGGDLFPARRHLVPAVVALAYLATIYVASRVPAEGSLEPVLRENAILLAALAIALVMDPMNVAASEEKWEWDGQAVGGLLATSFGAKKPLLAVDPAGCMPYFSKLPSVDMLGINDHYLARHRPADFGTGYLGHELGDGAYVLSRKPDLVLFNVPAGGMKPKFRSGVEMMNDPQGEFASTFRAVTLECGPPPRVTSIIWMRTEGGPIGIERSDDRIRIPGYLFSGNIRSRARLDGQGRLGVAVLPETSAELAGLSVPPGKWTVRVEGVGGEISMYVENARTGDIFASGPSGVTFALEAPAKVSIRLRTQEADGAHVHQVLLIRS